MKHETGRIDRAELLTYSGHPSYANDDVRERLVLAAEHAIVLAAEHAIDNGAERRAILTDRLVPDERASGE